MTEIHWSLMSERVLKACKHAAGRAKAFWNVDGEDAYHEALLWVLANPARVAKVEEEKNVRLAGWYVYQNALYRNHCLRSTWRGLGHPPRDKNRNLLAAPVGLIYSQDKEFMTT